MRISCFLIFWLMPSLCLATTSGPCVFRPGVDADVPERVYQELNRRGMGEYKLVRREECGDSVNWEAVPPGVGVNEITPPGLLPMVSLHRDGGVTVVPSDYRPPNHIREE